MADMYRVSPVRSNSLEMRRVGGLTIWSVVVFLLFSSFCFLVASATPLPNAGIRAAVGLSLGAATTTGRTAVVLLRVEARVTGLVITEEFYLGHTRVGEGQTGQCVSKGSKMAGKSSKAMQDTPNNNIVP